MIIPSFNTVIHTRALALVVLTFINGPLLNYHPYWSVCMGTGLVWQIEVSLGFIAWYTTCPLGLYTQYHLILISSRALRRSHRWAKLGDNPVVNYRVIMTQYCTSSTRCAVEHCYSSERSLVMISLAGCASWLWRFDAAQISQELSSRYGNPIV